MRLSRSTLSKTIIATVSAVGLFTVTACGNTDATDVDGGADGVEGIESPNETDSDVGTDNGPDNGTDTTLNATINNAEGDELGTAEFEEVDGAVRIQVETTDMEPGFYGLHIHETGLCEAEGDAPFTSAGGHLGGDEADHPDHAGDLPQLLVKDSGEAVLTFETDRLTLADLEDTALMIHTDPDNYANVPERYAEDGVDQNTLDTGDAGSRLGCAVIGD